MVLAAAQGTNIQLYVSTFYQEGGSPEFDEGIKDYINTNASAKSQQRRRRHHLRCDRHGL